MSTKTLARPTARRRAARIIPVVGEPHHMVAREPHPLDVVARVEATIELPPLETSPEFLSVTTAPIRLPEFRIEAIPDLAAATTDPYPPLRRRRSAPISAGSHLVMHTAGKATRRHPERGWRVYRRELAVVAAGIPRLGPDVIARAQGAAVTAAVALVAWLGYYGLHLPL